MEDAMVQWVTLKGPFFWTRFCPFSVIAQSSSSSPLYETKTIPSLWSGKSSSLTIPKVGPNFQLIALVDNGPLSFSSVKILLWRAGSEDLIRRGFGSCTYLTLFRCLRFSWTEWVEMRKSIQHQLHHCNATGILLMTSILWQYDQLLAKERIEQMYPAPESYRKNLEALSISMSSSFFFLSLTVLSVFFQAYFCFNLYA